MARTTRFNKRRAYKKRKATRKQRKSRKQYGGTCEIKKISELGEHLKKILEKPQQPDSSRLQMLSNTLSNVVSRASQVFSEGTSKKYYAIKLFSANDRETPFFSGEIVNVEYNNNLPVIDVLILQGQKCTNDKRQLTINSDNKIQIGSDVSTATHYRIDKLTKLGTDCTPNCIE
jgi:hypothetical protein